MPDTAPLRQASTGFRSVVAQVADDQWSLPTPCDGWSVTELAGHVAAGSTMVAVLAAGGTRGEAINLLGVDHLGDDPVGAIGRAFDGQLAAFERPDIDAQIFRHPAGDMPGAIVFNFRVGDLLVHQWDLARAIGTDETLDPATAEFVWNAIQPMLPMMAGSGVFGSGPSGTLGDDADVQTRLLDAMGRRP